ncbi:DUF1214 domain-containing protein [Noviherbaspirillum saxi]|uniref:DUF1214 domain-containing protein n=1 Tax=Noviherbaspirillum saxi TaxID=2320863 RepID=A0A3A3FJ32_9BURK|nr:DUF1214 domain-containing protein [Noviherbaspirillum saxi]RJF92554.1 DUF1214 domain-containing protein [Noviherbaspirillum saxi]
MTESVEQQLVSGQTWDAFCDILKRAGQQILRPEAPNDAFNRAEGFRYLSRLMRIALEMHVEYADPDFPGFLIPSHETAKIGADNPDNLYQYARLNGHNDYLVRGHRGSVAYLSFGSQKGGYETDGRMTQTGFIDTQHMQFDADGNFELTLSQTQAAGNWLPLEADSNALVVRQTFLDRNNEKLARLSIERIDSDQKPQPLDPLKLHGGLLKAAHFVENTAKLFADWANGYQSHPNQLPPANQAVCQAVGGDPNIFYYHSYWSLQDDEALLIEIERIPDCRFWNLQINNYWMESLDYRYHRIGINKHGAQLDARGGVTLVLSHTDPGLPNWLETAGHRVGTMCMRWVDAKEHVHPTTRVVKLSDLKRKGEHD